MLAGDDTAKAMLKQFNNIPMPNQNLDDAEIAQFVKYFHWFDQQPAPVAAKK
jgi:nitrite reductase (NO-forming)